MLRVHVVMPKFNKRSKSELLRQWVQDCGPSDYTTDGKLIFCQVCNKQIACEKKFQLSQHSTTNQHLAAKNKQSSLKQTLLTQQTPSSSNLKNEFCSDLCHALIAANIPWNSLNNPTFRNFLDKYCKHTIPSESTLRKNYLEDCYRSTIKEIQNNLKDCLIWGVVDETTDSCGRHVANFLVGKLSEDEPGKPFLIACRVLEKTNNSTIARFVNDALRILWPEGGNEHKFRVLLSDAAAYMLRAASSLKIFYPHLIHVTCIVHGLQRVAEVIREQFPEVNTLISTTKKVFVKAPVRVNAYREKLPEHPLPPEPILTRWGTWVSAALFYADNFSAVKEVVCSLNPNDSLAIKSSQDTFKNETIQRDLAIIKAHFKIIPRAIQKLETCGLSLHASISIFEEVKSELECAPPQYEEILSVKLSSILQRNPDFNILCSVNKYLQGNSVELPEEIPPELVSAYKYCPITSVDVERSFSAYKLILSDKRHKFTPENLEKIMIVYCKSNYSPQDDKI